ncbi:MAG: prephenate dehydrogenase/arogenate dehydrogenase family protein [Halioglobus sp.]
MTSSGSSIENKALVVGGSGAVGSLFCDLLGEYHDTVVALDPQKSVLSSGNKTHYVQGSLGEKKCVELIKQSRIVLLATPEAPTLAHINDIASLMTDKQCLIDTLSVKSRVCEILSNTKSVVEIVSINPMFGPSLGFDGQSLAYIPVRKGPIASQFLREIENAGTQTVECSAESHDRMTAATQATTHAAILVLGMAFSKLNYKPSTAKSIWTPPHQTMLAMLARILNADPEVYRDIQESNPYAREARDVLTESIGEFENTINSPVAFNELFRSLKELVGDDEESLARQAQEIFESIKSPNN